MVKIGLVLSAGGLRGAAHLGVLRKLLSHGVVPEVMVGASAGAIVSAFYAAVGVGVEEMIADARNFRGRHLLAHGLRLRLPDALAGRMLPYCGIIPARLGQLEAADFERLHFGVRGLGIVCHDVRANQPIYFCTGAAHAAPLEKVVRASAAIPGIMPARLLSVGENRFRLVDGGVSDPLPIDFARREPLGATHLIVSDCRSDAEPVSEGPALIYLHHALKRVSALRSPKTSLLEAVAEGEQAVSTEVLDRIRGWGQAAAKGSGPGFGLGEVLSDGS